MTIRTATDPDWERIIAIYNQAVKTGISTADLSPVTIKSTATWFRSHSKERYPIYVAEINSIIQGWCSISPYRPGRQAVRYTAEISYYVDENHKRQGVATGLIKHAMEDCPRIGIKTLFGILLETNKPSERLLIKLGFEQWGCLPDVADFDGKECGHLYLGKRIC